VSPFQDTLDELLEAGELRYDAQGAMAAALWVVNASPLIALAKIGRLELLQGPSRTLLVPEAVAAEIVGYRSRQPHDHSSSSDRQDSIG
jgi:hypothetical protein